MDEYTFILLAKLKAERTRLDRERCVAVQLEKMPDAGPIAGDRRAGSRAFPGETPLRKSS